MSELADAAGVQILLVLAAVLSVIWSLSMLDRRPSKKREWIAFIAFWAVVIALAGPILL